MFVRLKEAVLPRIIGLVVHKAETLTQKEMAAEINYLGRLEVKRGRTVTPVIIAMIGLVGSGKSSVARELARHIGGVVVEGDGIRVELRKLDEKYDSVRLIAENIAINVAGHGNHVILDSDFIDEKKRASIREKMRKAFIRLVFIRTHCDPDVMMGRILAAEYEDSPDDFFGGASSMWSGPHKGAIVKWREMDRRKPQHYRWVNEVGGRWVLRTPPFQLAADIDTTNEAQWKLAVARLAKQL